MINTYKFTPQSAEWLAKRSQNITATEVASLLGLDKYKTPHKVLKEKINPVKLADNAAMRAGRILEPGVFVALKEIGLNCRPADYEKVVMYEDPEVRLSCTLDGIGINKDKGKYIVECKSTKPELFEKWEDQAPINYIIQVQVQLMLTKLDKALLACVSQQFPFSIIVYYIKADKEIHKIIEYNVRKFWTCYEKNVKFKIDKENIAELISSLYKSSELFYG